MKRFLKILSITLLSVLSGCAEDALEIQEQQSDYKAKSSMSWKVIDGRMYFNSEEELVILHRQLAEEKIINFLNNV